MHFNGNEILITEIAKCDNLLLSFATLTFTLHE
jgi:hypothetical protein